MDMAPGDDTDVIADVADRRLVESLFRDHDFEGVIHAAALHKPDIARYPRRAFIDTNVTGTLNLLEEAVKQGVSRFVFTSTTSLMITQAIRDETAKTAVWLDETSAPLKPRNIYGVTKRSAEELCRLFHADFRLPIIVLRTARFFPEDDDTHRSLSAENLKTNEFLNRRLTVEDCARSHIVALEHAHVTGFGLYVVSAPTPFSIEDAAELKRDAPAAIARYFPEAAALYATRGWQLPKSIGRVYDASKIERELGFRCETDFASVLATLRRGKPLPFASDPTYLSPNAQSGFRRLS